MDRERPPPPPPETHRVVILGGGVAGLACARYLLGGSLPDAPPEAEADESDAAAAEPPLAQGRNSNDKQKKKACEVVILEAADRLGGRLWTRTFAGAKVDAGAAWVACVSRASSPRRERQSEPKASTRGVIHELNGDRGNCGASGRRQEHLRIANCRNTPAMSEA